jgi:hypothetical protein
MSVRTRSQSGCQGECRQLWPLGEETTFHLFLFVPLAPFLVFFFLFGLHVFNSCLQYDPYVLWLCVQR